MTKSIALSSGREEGSMGEHHPAKQEKTGKKRHQNLKRKCIFTNLTRR